MNEPVTNAWTRACGKWLLICLLFSAWIAPATISSLALALGWPSFHAAESLWNRMKRVRAA